MGEPIAALTHQMARKPASVQPLVHAKQDRTWVELPDGVEVSLCAAAIARSKLLTDICDNDEAPWDAPLAIDAQALQHWLKHVQAADPTTGVNDVPATAAAHKAPADLHATEEGRNCQGPSEIVLGNTADVVGDDQTPAQHAKRTATEESAASQADRSTQGPLKSPKLDPSEQALELCNLLQVRKLTQQVACMIAAESFVLALTQRARQEAADILLDEKTEEEACAALATLLRAEIDSNLSTGGCMPPSTSQALAALASGLIIKVLRAVDHPFPTLLRYLSTTPFPPHLLHAHHPSIDAHASLSLAANPVPYARSLLHHIATFTRLEVLSLEGSPLVPAPDSHGGGEEAAWGLERMLRALPRLTHLCLRDTTLRASADALAAALPALPHLHTLDISGNHLDGAFDKLAAALPAAPALRTLLLHGACTSARALRALVAALRKMPGLEELSIGAPARLVEWHIPDVPDAVRYMHLLLDVFAALRTIKALRSLALAYELPCGLGDAVAGNAPVGAAVASLTQLHHLHLGTLELCNTFDGLDATMHERARSSTAEGSEGLTAEPDSGFASLQNLTSLSLADVNVADTLTAVRVTVLLPSLSGLSRMQQLQLPRLRLRAADCEAILSTARSMPQLTQLAVGAAAQSARLPVRALAVGLVQLPHLRHIVVPAIMDGATLAPFGVWPGPGGWADVVDVLLEAAVEKVVEVDLVCYRYGFREEGEVDENPEGEYEEPEYEAHKELLASALRLCHRISLLTFPRPFVEVFWYSTHTMSALTQLEVDLTIRDDDADEWEMYEDAQQALHKLGSLTGLQSLAVTSTMCGQVGRCSMVCRQLGHLRQLTNLELGFGISDQQAVPQLLERCRSLPSLRRLQLRLADAPKDFHLYSPSDVEDWWDDDEAPRGWDVSELTTLQTLLVLNHTNLSADEEFWDGLFRLPRLQSLHLNDTIDDAHLLMLELWLQGRSSQVLQELHVRARMMPERRAELLRAAAGQRVAIMEDAVW